MQSDVTSLGGKFDFEQVESYWQDLWLRDNVYEAKDGDESREKKYILTEFPYPSGSSLHVGHCFRYTVPDVYARFLRMRGYNVLFPIGWDAFGLPTEERARKEGKNPTVITKENIANFKKQVLRMGYGFDWNREFATTDPEYYKWTQWIFGEFYKAGLAEQKEVELWWCPEMGTVLSNEEVLDGPDGTKISERGEHPVYRKKMTQWILKMPQYAEKLLDGLEETHFPQHVKEMQRNWIGKSEGCTVGWEASEKLKVESEKWGGEFKIQNSKFKIVILHGYGADAQSNFFPWLQSELESQGHEVWLKNLPNTDDPDVCKQVDFVLNDTDIDKRTVIIGHSLGAVVAMKLVEKLSQPLAGLFLVAGFSTPEFIGGFSAPFIDKIDWSFDFDKIKQNAGQVKIFGDTQDCYVPVSQGKGLAQKLSGELFEYEAEQTHFMQPKETRLLSEVVKLNWQIDPKHFDARDILIRKYEPKDHAEVLELHVRPIVDFIKYDLNLPKSDPDLFKIPQEYLSEFGSDFFVIELNGKLVAMAGLKRIDEQTVELRRMRVEPEMQSRGLGQQIMNELERRAVNLGYSRATLRTAIGLMKARKMYEKNGYREFAREINEFDDIEILMQKDLFGVPKKLSDGEGAKVIHTFTTRVDTIFAATFLVLAPEHPLVGQLTTEDRRGEVERYVREANNKSERERQIGAEKTGVFTGSYAVNPVTGESTPIWVADYVLGGYGTGAIMAVPGHDERDCEFAKKFGLEIKKNVQSKDGIQEHEEIFTDYGFLYNSGEFTGLETEEAKVKIAEKLESLGKGRREVNYKFRDWVFSRQRYWGEPFPFEYVKTNKEILIKSEKVFKKLENRLEGILFEAIDQEKDIILGNLASKLAERIGWDRPPEIWFETNSHKYGWKHNLKHHSDISLVEYASCLLVTVFNNNAKIYTSKKKENTYLIISQVPTYKKELSLCEYKLVDNKLELISVWFAPQEYFEKNAQDYEEVFEGTKKDPNGRTENSSIPFLAEMPVSISGVRWGNSQNDKTTDDSCQSDQTKYLIFDFDGVLADSFHTDIQTQINLGTFGTDDWEFNKQKIIEYFDRTEHSKQDNLSSEELAKINERREKIAAEYKKIGIQYFEGFIQEIQKLTNVKLAVVSSGSNNSLQEFAAKINLPFTHVLGWEDGHSKEDKIAKILQVWGVGPEQAYYFTDTKADVMEISNLLPQSQIIGCSWGFHGYEKLRELLPDGQILSDFKEIHQLFPSSSYTEIDGEFYQIKLLEQSELPLILPDVEDYQPSVDGRSPLAKTDWIELKDSEGKVIGRREADTMPNWAGSSWYYLRYCDSKNSTVFADYDKLKYWLPVDHYFGGSEHTTLHLLYSRFWHKFLFDRGYVPTSEPYDYRTNGGLLLGPDGRKMSKSLGNVINPDDKLEESGADALRLYINFIGPYDGTVIWQDGGLKACKRLVDTVWGLRERVEDSEQGIVNSDKKLLSAYHKMVKKVTEQVDSLRTNVAVAELMTFTNLLKEAEIIPHPIWTGFLQVLAPLAPHISEELWYQAWGFDRSDSAKSVHLTNWPEFDPELCVEDEVTIVVQVNGKVRAEFQAAKDASEEDLMQQAKTAGQKWLEGKEIKFSKVVANKMVTFAVK